MKIRFQKVEPKELKSKTIKFRSTEYNFEILKVYCIERGISISEFIRDAISFKLLKHGVNTEYLKPDTNLELFIKDSIKKFDKHRSKYI